jgi:hypothetical protein
MSATSDAQDRAVPKLPLWDTIGSAYSTYFHNFLDVLLICWFWFVVVAPLMALGNWLQLSWLARTMAQLRQGVRPQGTDLWLSLLIGYGGGLLFMAAGISIAVAWHRRVILGEQTRFSASNAVTGSFWRYIGVGILIGLVAIIPMVLGLLVVTVFLIPLSSHAIPGSQHMGIIVLIALVILFVYLMSITVMLRLCLLLPARAVGDLSVTFKQAWRRLRGNTWRIFWGILACTVPPALIIEIVSLVLLGSFIPRIVPGNSLPVLPTLPVVPLIAISVIFMVYYLLILPIWIGFLSLSYLHFFGRRPDYGLR